MNLKTFVKVGGVTNLSDARFCAGFGVDMLGFDINEASSDYIPLKTALEIMGWIEGPKFVAEVGDMLLDKITDLQEENKFPFIQVDNVLIGEELIKKGNQVILKLTINEAKDLSQLDGIKDSFAYVLIDSQNEELFQQIDEKLSTSTNAPSIIKAYNNTTDTVQLLTNSTKITGIELKGSQEDKPGFKEYDELADILEELEIEN